MFLPISSAPCCCSLSHWARSGHTTPLLFGSRSDFRFSPSHVPEPKCNLLWVTAQLLGTQGPESPTVPHPLTNQQRAADTTFLRSHLTSHWIHFKLPHQGERGENTFTPHSQQWFVNVNSWMPLLLLYYEISLLLQLRGCSPDTNKWHVTHTIYA